VVVAATGTSPTLPAALGDGRTVRVDGTLRVLGERDVWACGDVACYDHPRYGSTAPPHWEHARLSGRHAADAIHGSAARYARDPYWFSDIGRLRLQQIGLASAATSWRDDGDGLSLGLDRGGRTACVTLVDAPRRLAEARTLLVPTPGEESP
jgi:NADH dehydrogenase FAD-containing subunit